MNFFNILAFTQNKYNYFHYTFLAIFIFIILHKLDIIFTNNVIIRICITLFIIFLYFKYNSQLIFNNFKKYKHKIEAIKNLDLKYLENDLVILSIYDSIMHFKDFNSKAFNKSLQNINIFLENYDVIQNSNKFPIYIYESAVWRRSEAINQLNSIILSIPKDTAFSDVNLEHIVIDKSYEVKLLKAIKTIRAITLKYLYEMEAKINKQWKENSIYNYSYPIFSGDPAPNPYKDPLFSQNYNLYQ